MIFSCDCGVFHAATWAHTQVLHVAGFPITVNETNNGNSYNLISSHNMKVAPKAGRPVDPPAA